MDKLYRLCENIEAELHKIEEKGLNTANLETAYKLIDMYKDIKNTEYWEKKGDYYMAALDEMQGGYSHYSNEYSDRGRKRDSMGRYARNDRGGRSYRDSYFDGNSYYSRYMDSKQSYRNDKSMDGKQRLMDSLEDYMDDFTNKIREMHRDADTPEEREMISKFMTKLQNIR